MPTVTRYPLTAFATIALLIFSSIAPSAAELDLPFPLNTEIVFWLRPQLISNDANLTNLFAQSKLVRHYLDLIGLSTNHVDYAAVFMPHDQVWMTRITNGAIENLPASAAMIIKGAFDPAAKYKHVKSSGWREEKYANKKLLWWSTGVAYLKQASGGECMARLGNDKLLIAGSEESLKGVLDVAGDKTTGIESMGVMQDISSGFFENDLAMSAAFIKVTDDFRQMVKAGIGEQQSAMIRTAIGYVDNVDEMAISVINGPGNYLFDAYLGMDSGNNAIIVTSVLQAGGGMAGLLPEDAPGRATLENLTATRSGRIVKVQSRMPHDQLYQLLGHGNHQY
ncbi:MAG: hypothetical protein A2W25_12730 [candidate division Zixibacteria bacterium RBG_16_53_22]|nr:MAG: hypothetical protein A2W25_12730 [candidate division Zixibacteria bacterium RBG_16_53_22]